MFIVETDGKSKEEIEQEVSDSIESRNKKLVKLGYSFTEDSKIIPPEFEQEKKTKRKRDKFRGCLLAGAVGDALGYEVEFMREDAILKKFGKSGITEYAIHNGVAEISDDTQMTLFTATGLLFATTRGMMQGIMGDYQDYIRESYDDWYVTQTESFPPRSEIFTSWLANIPQFYHRRAPGKTCLSVLKNDEYGSLANRVNHSKGCGGVMRVAPIGLYFCESKVSVEESDRIGAEVAALTHGHDLGWLPAAALVHIIRLLAENEGETIEHAVQDSMNMLRNEYSSSDYLHVLISLMQKAIDLSSENYDDLIAIHMLGQGWEAEETLAIAIYCALKYPDNIEKALIAAVNHNGDSDSTGSVTGNILGAALGKSAIPVRFLEKLELVDLIQEVADDLYNDCKMSEYDDFFDPVWYAKYISICYPEVKRRY